MPLSIVGSLLTFDIVGLVCWQLVRRRKVPSDYALLATPYPDLVIYRTVKFSTDVQTKFLDVLSMDSVQIKLKEILARPGGIIGDLKLRVYGANFHLLKPERPGRVFGWAQTVGPRDPTLLLGYEPFMAFLGPLLSSAVAHELCHCAQEVREGVLSSEWSPFPFGGRRRKSRIELEALLYFMGWPMVFIVIIVIHLVVFCGPILWRAL